MYEYIFVVDCTWLNISDRGGDPDYHLSANADANTSNHTVIFDTFLLLPGKQCISRGFFVYFSHRKELYNQFPPSSTANRRNTHKNTPLFCITPFFICRGLKSPWNERFRPTKEYVRYTVKKFASWIEVSGRTNPVWSRLRLKSDETSSAAVAAVGMIQKID